MPVGYSSDRPPETIVTTSWDDGQKIDLKLADLLTQYNIKGTFYITKTYRDHLDDGEVARIGRKHEIGSHTLNHPHLTRLALPDAKKEIEGSKKYLEGILNRNVKMFSYPYGDFNDDIARLVKNAGYDGARTVKMGHFGRPDDFYKWHVTLSTCSQISMLKFFKSIGVYTRSLSCLIDTVLYKKELLNIALNRKIGWENCAIKMFDMAMKRGGVFHLWGHAYEIEAMNEWPGLERVLKHISNKKGVSYMTNGEVIEKLTGPADIAELRYGPSHSRM